MTRKLTLIILACATLVLFNQLGFISSARTELDIRARQIVAQRNDVPFDRLSVENSATATFPLQALSATNFKIADLESGEVYPIALDDNGEEVVLDEVRQREVETYRARYGRLEIDLANTLDNTDPNEAIRINIWLKPAGEITLKRPDPAADLDREQVDQLFKKLDDERRELASRATRGVVERLAGIGIEASANELAPVIYAKVPAFKIREIENWEEIDQIYLDRVNKPHLAVARATIGAAAVHSRGILGSGVRVAQIESQGGKVAAANPFLFFVQDTRFICGFVSDHSTAVAGILVSTNQSIRGISPFATLWAGGSCAGWSSELEDRTAAAQNFGARALNLSFGGDTNLTMTGFDRFYDDVVMNGWRTVVLSAGNNGRGTGNVESPGLAYNVIAVGELNDRNTVVWSDDIMHPSSSFNDPRSTHNDREKPEVAAPGTDITTTGITPPWNNLSFGSTSLAAPMVTGTAALMMNAKSSLSVNPEAVKAILMATARNIEGASRLSDKDGAGGIDADRATRVAAGIRGKWGMRSYLCSAARVSDVDTMTLTAGRLTRVAMAWDSPTIGNEPGADLDMQILDPNGQSVTGSSSFDNTYEIVEFTPMSTGTYTLRVNKFRCSDDPKWLGWAWHFE